MTDGALDSTLMEEEKDITVGDSSFCSFNWNPSPILSTDENYLDLTLLITRNSTCIQGHMACLLIKERKTHQNTANQKDNSSIGSSLQDLVSREDYLSQLVSVANNNSLYKPLHSDVHAEICAVANAARRGLNTNNCTAYITMPPCKDCFGALVRAGICRVVSRSPSTQLVREAAARIGVEMVVIQDTEASKSRQQEQVRVYYGKAGNDARERVVEERKKRKAQQAFQRSTSKKHQPKLMKHASIDNGSSSLDESVISSSTGEIV